MHISIRKWLEAVGLTEYEPLFRKYSGVEELLDITEAALKSLGIKNWAHRAKLISSLQLLKEKYERHKGKRPQPPVTLSSLQRSHSAHAATPVGPVYQDCNALTASPEKMQQDLQVELQADDSDLRSHVWYHGNIPRQRAEKLVVNKGDYLVRDCVSQPGNFVLTCNWMGTALHFMINAKVVAHPNAGAPSVFYQFEDVSCKSVQDLLQYYKDMKRPITETSKVIISNPIGRSMPLSYYDTKYGATANLTAKLGLQETHTPSQSPKPSPFASPERSPRGSPKLKRTPYRTGSQPLLSTTKNQKSPPSLSDQYGSSPNINTEATSSKINSEVRSPFHQRSGSEPLLTPTPTNENKTFSYEHELEEKLNPATSEGNLNKAPPPKPSRVPSVKYLRKPKVQVRNKKLYEEDDERDYTDYDTIKSKPSWVESYTKNQHAMEKLKADLQAQNAKPFMARKAQPENIYDNNFSVGDPIYEPLKNNVQNVEMRKTKNDSFNKNGEIFYDSNFLKGRVISMPALDNEINSNASFTSSLLPVENRPLEASVMLKVKTLLLECNAKLLARHLTQVDLEVSKVTCDDDLGVGVQSGLELITLPQGKQLRQDLMERSRCMHMFVATMVLSLPSILERARMLSQWISMAMELRTSMGNLFGFVTVMDGIMAPEIQRLRDTWMILRQNHTSSAFLFDTKLKTFYKSLCDGSAMLPVEKVSIPNISAFVSLLERDSSSIMDSLAFEDNEDFGLDILLTHLDTARFISHQFGIYRSMGEAIMKDFDNDPELRDMFSTPFHLRLLWGSRGAGVNRPDRYNKYQQLMMVLSERAERPDDQGTEL